MDLQRPWQRWYDPGVPLTLDYPDLSLKDQFNHWVEVHPDQPLVYWHDLFLTYGQVNTLARKLADSLKRLGVAPGDRVAISLPNIPQFFVTAHACMKMGAVMVPANPLYTEKELGYQFADSGTETVFCVAPLAEKVIHLLEDAASPVKRVVTVQLPGQPVELPAADHLFDMDELVAAGEDVEPDIAARADDLILLLYTGGTTGVPKGCCITNANMNAISTCYLTWAQSLISRERFKTLCTIPLYHIYGFNSQINFTIHTGGSSVLLPEVNPDTILAAINKHEPNFWPTIPALIQAMTLHPELPDSKVGSIKCILSGSAPLPVEVMKKFEAVSGAKILEGFGSSETTNGITTNPVNKQKAGSIGIPFPDHDIKIMDIETGAREMAQGEVGEIVVRGPVVVSGYWQNPEETAAAFRDGWFYTGDMGYLDEDFYCYIVDRKKDMIICSGFNVYPREIDELLYTHAKILEAGAVGVPDEKRGETVKVFVVLRPGETMTQEEVIAYCRQQLAPYKVPKIVEFIDALPRTSVNKVDRKALRAREEK